MIMLLFTSLQAAAQKMDAVPGLEKTVAGVESSFSMNYESKRQWRMGMFYQTAISIPFVQSQEADASYEWYGVSIAAPLAKTEKIAFYGRLRAGYANANFMVVAPSVETHIKISKAFAVSVGSGYRMGHTSFSFQTHLRLF